MSHFSLARLLSLIALLILLPMAACDSGGPGGTYYAGNHDDACADDSHGGDGQRGRDN